MFPIRDYLDQIQVPNERELAQSLALFRIKRSSLVSLGWDTHNLEPEIMKNVHFDHLGAVLRGTTSDHTRHRQLLTCPRVMLKQCGIHALAYRRTLRRSRLEYISELSVGSRL